MGVQCRKVDLKLVEQALKEAEAEYAKKVGRSVKATIDRQDFLDDSSAGGVVVTALYGRIRCANTLESRLDLVAEQVHLCMR